MGSGVAAIRFFRQLKAFGNYCQIAVCQFPKHTVGIVSRRAVEMNSIAWIIRDIHIELANLNQQAAELAD